LTFNGKVITLNDIEFRGVLSGFWSWRNGYKTWQYRQAGGDGVFQQRRNMTIRGQEKKEAQRVAFCFGDTRVGQSI